MISYKVITATIVRRYFLATLGSISPETEAALVWWDASSCARWIDSLGRVHLAAIRSQGAPMVAGETLATVLAICAVAEETRLAAAKAAGNEDWPVNRALSAHTDRLLKLAGIDPGAWERAR